MSNMETVETRRATSLLNDCIEVCVDGQKFFAIAAANVRAPALKEAFQRYSDQRAAFVLALQAQMGKAGMMPENEGSLGGAARRELMEVVRSFEPMHRDVPIVRECINELEAALRVYGNVARVADSLPIDLRVALEEQSASIRSALTETLKRLDSH